MDARADAFVALPGGFGTLEELLEVLTLRQLRLHDRPIVLVNVAGYWDPFLAMVSEMVDQGFAPLGELMANFAKAGGTMYVCSPCFKKRKLDENNLVPGASIVGGAKLVEFLSDGSPCVSY